MRQQLAAFGCATLTTLLAACGGAGALEDGRAAGKDGNVTITVDNIDPYGEYTFDLSIEPAGIVRSFVTPNIALSVPAGEHTFKLSVRTSSSTPFASGSASAVVESGRKTSVYIGLVQTEPTDIEKELGLVMTSLSASPVDVVQVGETVSLQVSAVSFDNLPITYLWEDNCGGVFQNNDSEVTSWVLNNVAEGCLITVTAFAGSKKLTKTVYIAVVGQAEGSVDVGAEILPSARISSASFGTSNDEFVCFVSNGDVCAHVFQAGEFGAFMRLFPDDVGGLNWNPLTWVRVHSSVSGSGCANQDYDYGWSHISEASVTIPVQLPAVAAACRVEVIFETRTLMADSSVINHSSKFTTGFVFVE